MEIKNCEICSSALKEVGNDSPVYCFECIKNMEKLELSPDKYRQYLELKGSLK